MIDQVIALTIPRSVDRQWLYFGRMTAMGVPANRIFFFRGADAKHFNNSYDKIADAAEKDGYPFVRQFQGYTDVLRVQQTPSQMAQVWSYAKILRYITEIDQTVLVTWDDRYLTTSFNFLAQLVHKLKSLRDFYMFQLRIRGWKRELMSFIRPPENQDPHDEERIHYIMGLNREMFSLATSPHYQPSFENEEVFVRRGMYGMDETIVFSPAGAQLLLDYMMDMEDIDPDIKKMDQHDLTPTQMEEYGKRLNIDTFLYWGFLHKALPKILKDNPDIGIYCPRALGFDFIEDSIPMGSLHGWTNSLYSPESAKTVNQKISLQYIN